MCGFLWCLACTHQHPTLETTSCVRQHNMDVFVAHVQHIPPHLWSSPACCCSNWWCTACSEWAPPSFLDTLQEKVSGS